MFKGILIDKADSDYRVTLSDIESSSLPEGDVTVEVQYSSLNYKDALAITGNPSVVRKFPMIPGIDLVGVVTDSKHPEFSTGMPVILNGWGAGENHWGGLAQKAKLKGDWLIPLPKSFDSKQAMAIGTAGYTAMLCILALEEQGVTPSDGEILVTGATGGVGSVAVAVLSKLGYKVVALTGRIEESEYVTKLGASEVISRNELSEPGRPLQKERWAGVVDVVGSNVLANACASTKYGGVVTACGLAGGMDFPTTVIPFILRGVSLIGIDSVMCPKNKRLDAWHRLEKDLDISKLGDIASEIGLSETINAAEKLLAGEMRGRIIVDVNR